jgi:putative urate catabolism protein
MTNQYPRDLIGYGELPPNPHWPNDAKIALQFVVNYEEGGENCVLHGDEGSEQFLSEIVGAESYSDRHLSMESIYEYGSRSGFWRLHRLFNQYQVPVTVFGVATALEKNPSAVAAMQQSNWEIASHGLRWIHYQHFTEQQEREHIEQAIEIHKRVTGSKPKGWYTGRTSPHTLKIIAERDDILYCADSYADDLPYWDTQYSKPLLIVPYTLDSNDMRFATPQGFNTGEHFFQYLKDAFDELYQEGSDSPKMLSIGLHCRLAGRPGRLAGLRRFLDYVKGFDDVWCTTREAIAEHWLAEHPYNTEPSKLSAPLKQNHVVADLRSAIPQKGEGVLSGLTVSVKDLFDVEGTITGAGLPIWAETAQPATQHAESVTRLLDSGAQLGDKTQLDELAYSLAGDNSHYGLSLHPHSDDHLSGGSSSGAAVSVARGESDIGLASDTGGSVRVPASYCGLYGLRPTQNSISTKGMVPLAPRFDTVGLLTRDMQALKKASCVLLNHNELQTLALRKSVDRPLAWCEALWSGVDVKTKQLSRALFDAYEGEKMQLDPPVLDSKQRAACFTVLQAESIWRTHYEWLSAHKNSFGESVRQRIDWGESIPLTKQIQADKWLKQWRDALPFWLPKGVVLMLPTTPTTAPKAESLLSAHDTVNNNSREQLLGLTAIAGLSGWPQLSCPILPASTQLKSDVMEDKVSVHSISFLAHQHRELDLFDMAQRVLSV